MDYNGVAKVQHYVPQFLLRNFGVGKKRKFYVYDKANNKIFSTTSKNIACESRFYDFEVKVDNSSISGTIEHKLSDIECNAQSALKKIIDSDNLSVMTDEDKRNILMFLAAQVVRTKNSRINWENLPVLFRDEIERRFPSCNFGDELKEYIEDIDTKRKNFDFDMFVAKATEEFAGLFYEKVWIWGINDSKKPFFISDDPVVVYNHYQKVTPFFNPHGFGVLGADTYLPITSNRILWLACPVKSKEMQNVYESNETLIKVNRIFSGNINNFKSIENLYIAITKMQPIDFEEDNIKFVNSLQVMGAERYIISRSDDFTFAEKILKEHPEYKQGKRIIIN